MDMGNKDASASVVDVQSLQPGTSGLEEHPLQQRENRRPGRKSGSMLTTVWRRSPGIFMVSYFVFSISIYTLSTREAVKVLWFFYLSIATILGGIALLEAYDGLSLLRNARKAVSKHARSGWTDDDSLPFIELIFDDEHGTGNGRVHALRESILYPQEKMRIILLPDHGDDTALVNHLCNVQDRQSGPLPEYTAVFRAQDSPHPHALRHAIARLTTDYNIDIVQSRTVLVWSSGVPRLRAISSSLAAFFHDATYGLSFPGRTVTWGIPISHGSAIYGRTAALQTTFRSLKDSSSRHNGPAVAFSAYAQNTRAAYDLSVVTYRQCPKTLLGCSRLQIQTAAEWVACLPYVSLAFTKAKRSTTTFEKSNSDPKATRALKQRVSILLTLLLARLGSHAVLQYFSLALAFLFSSTPQSAADFSKLIFFPYHISIWLIISGLLCLVGRVAMIHKAASEYAPPGWAFPILLVIYPLSVLVDAVVDVYAQAGVFLGAL
jgi:hypothetical protein